MPARSTRPPAARERSRSPRQRGQVLVVFALMATVLVGFCGLALDAAVSNDGQRSLQATADAAALAAAYRVYAGDQTPMATAVAAQVAADDGCTAATSCTLTVTYEDSSFAPTLLAANASYVVAGVTQTHTDRFIQVLTRSNTTTIAATATAQVYQSATRAAPNLPCGLCLLDTGPNALVGTGAGVAIAIAQGDLDVNGNVSLSGTGSAIAVVSGRFNVTPSSGNTFGSWLLAPAATLGTPAIPDPLAAVPTPLMAGLPSYPSPYIASNTTLSPGIYGQVDVSGAVVLLPGTYVFAGAGGGLVAPAAPASITGVGVTLYFTCGSVASSGTPVAAPCAAAGENGAALSSSQALTMNIAAPLSGLLSNMLIYYDRNNTSGITLDANVGGTNVGAVYAARSRITITSSTTVSVGAPIVAADLSISCCGINIGSSAGVGQITTRTPGDLYS
ncbi:MAG: pilus assembly protein TadG-related protein [Candidatus Dormibacteria bacterium]